MKYVLFLLSFFVMLVIGSCSNDSSDTEGSSSTGSSSHNTGKNCLGCHSFKAAGSVYNQAFTSSYSGVIIKLTSGANGTGTVLATFTSDKSGNYYTNSSISFGAGIYVSASCTGGTIKYMSSAVTNGACNSCHNGSTTLKVWAE
jgi:hypothetical protein